MARPGGLCQPLGARSKFRSSFLSEKESAMEYPKRIKRELRELAGQAHENELGRELEKLAQHFDEWREEKIDAASLTELIHQYHNGPARELWKKYNSGFVEVLVAQAIVSGILQKEQVTEEAWPYVEEAIEKYKLISQ